MTASIAKSASNTSDKSKFSKGDTPAIPFSGDIAPHQYTLGLPTGDHLRAVHNHNTSGVATCLQEVGAAFTSWQTLPVDMAADTVDLYDGGTTPVYMGMQAITPGHQLRKDNTRFLLSAYVDLDTYKVGCTLSAEEIVNEVRAKYPQLPVPTLIGRSGGDQGGWHLQWVFKDGRAMCFDWSWHHIQRRLLEVFAPYGADSGSMKMTQLYRLSGSYNPKYGTHAAIVKTGFEVDYQDLLDFQGDLYHAELAKQNSHIPAHHPKNGTKAKRGKAATVHQLPTRNIYTLHKGRQDDYRTLATLRGGRFKQHRTHAIVLYAVAATWCQFNEGEARSYTEDFIRDCIYQPEKYLNNNMDEIFKRQQQAEAGETIQWAGIKVDPRYKYLSKTIITLLDITPDEMPSMSRVITPEVKYDRKVVKRREAGIQEREVYDRLRVEQSKQRKQMAFQLSDDGLTQTGIAVELGVSQQHISRYLVNDKGQYVQQLSDNRAKALELSRHGLTQTEIGSLLGVTQGRISQYLNELIITPYT